MSPIRLLRSVTRTPRMGDVGAWETEQPFKGIKLPSGPVQRLLESPLLSLLLKTKPFGADFLDTDVALATLLTKGG